MVVSMIASCCVVVASSVAAIISASSSCDGGCDFCSNGGDGGCDFCSNGGVNDCFLLCGGGFFSGGCFLLCGTGFFMFMVCRCSLFSLMASVFVFFLIVCVLCMVPSMVHMLPVPVTLCGHPTTVVVPFEMGGPVAMVVVVEVLLMSGPPRRL